MRFTKMHGAGNDYIYVDCFTETVRDPSKTARIVSDRHFGVGSDGLVLILPSEKADFRMRMFNADGTEAEMCGNAIRCVGKYLYDNNMTCGKQEVTIETLAGVKALKLFVRDGLVSEARVDMGEPCLKPALIPVISEKEIFVDEPVNVDGEIYRLTCVSMGNPHAITYMPDVDSYPLHVKGPAFEHHPLFPKRTNTEIVQVIDRQTLKMRVWERGAGETLACGTGACAVLVASVLNGVSDRKATVKLLGGELLIEWDEETNHVFMTGPAVKVFEGVIEIEQ